MAKQKSSIPGNELDTARAIVDSVEDLQGEDILLLDVSKICAYADFFVILSAGSARQIDAIKESVQETANNLSVKLNQSEGSANSGWVLMDFSDIIVHIFSREGREFYRLDELWNDAENLVRIQ
jgi:ribosome-associated protein